MQTIRNFRWKRCFKSTHVSGKFPNSLAIKDHPVELVTVIQWSVIDEIKTQCPMSHLNNGLFAYNLHEHMSLVLSLSCVLLCEYFSFFSHNSSYCFISCCCCCCLENIDKSFKYTLIVQWIPLKWKLHKMPPFSHKSDICKTVTMAFTPVASIYVHFVHYVSLVLRMKEGYIRFDK